jgi:uncharacterized protein (DUF983 family)
MAGAPPELGTLLGRALKRRCPRCGTGRPFSGWFRMMESCPDCGHRYERESGYWVTALIVNTAVTEAVFGVLFVAVLIATIPDVPWLPVLLVAAATNVIVPVLFYPLSKTVWVAIDLYFHPPGTDGRPPPARF